MSVMRGIEVGHIFKLGDKYSRSMNAAFLDAEGAEQHFVMGCYGIGVGRTAAAAIEQNHDDNGIIWPVPLAPYEALVLAIKAKDPAIAEACERLERELEQLGVDVLYDERDERPGVKFKDADLLGIPFRITVGSKGLARGVVELKRRHEKEFTEVPLDQAAQLVAQAVAEEKL